MFSNIRCTNVATIDCRVYNDYTVIADSIKFCDSCKIDAFVICDVPGVRKVNESFTCTNGSETFENGRFRSSCKLELNLCNYIISVNAVRFE
ncbi:hypothetical protein BB561_006274 [Smittium simulii]|uniref:Uncharacterized protein n=1 Tax=Smittium simulii TaxID=133385 RepID=A0A2T9Y5H9_9FUNG|nr:hypothetical protein BB561_006274 [Smittium simulii]